MLAGLVCSRLLRPYSKLRPFFKAGTTLVAGRLMILYGAGKPKPRVLQELSFLLRKLGSLELGKDVSESSLQLLKFCAKHGGLRFLPLSRTIGAR